MERFRALLSYVDMQSLLSEEIEPVTGNYPQAFSHIGLIARTG